MSWFRNDNDIEDEVQEAIEYNLYLMEEIKTQVEANNNSVYDAVNELQVEDFEDKLDEYYS